MEVPEAARRGRVRRVATRTTIAGRSVRVEMRGLQAAAEDGRMMHTKLSLMERASTAAAGGAAALAALSAGEAASADGSGLTRLRRDARAPQSVGLAGVVGAEAEAGQRRKGPASRHGRSMAPVSRLEARRVEAGEGDGYQAAVRRRVGQNQLVVTAVDGTMAALRSLLRLVGVKVTRSCSADEAQQAEAHLEARPVLQAGGAEESRSSGSYWRAEVVERAAEQAADGAAELGKPEADREVATTRAHPVSGSLSYAERNEHTKDPGSAR